MRTAFYPLELTKSRFRRTGPSGWRTRFSVLLAGLMLAAIGSTSQGRSFTGRTGTKVEAEVISVSLAKSTVLLRLPNGHEADVPFANVSVADQDYLRRWKPAAVDAEQLPVLGTSSATTLPLSTAALPSGSSKASSRPTSLGSLQPASVVALGAPGETIVLEFPELAKDRQGEVAKCKVRLPDQYDAARPMPLLLWLAPGEGSNDPQNGVSLVDGATWAVAAMPFPSSAAPPNQAFDKKQMPIIWNYHKAMLKKLVAALPNVDPKLRFAGGHSNGAHCVATYMADGEREFIEFFNGFIIIEGGCLRYDAKKKLRTSYAYLAWGDSDGNNEGFMAGIKSGVKDGKLKATSRIMTGVGHDFPDAERNGVKGWIERVAVPGLAKGG